MGARWFGCLQEEERRFEKDVLGGESFPVGKFKNSFGSVEGRDGVL